MTDETIFITGISGEIGHGLLEVLDHSRQIVGLDIDPLENKLQSYLSEFIQADILDASVLDQIFKKYNVVKVFHLASILSTAAEKDPGKAQQVNVEGSFNLMQLTQFYSQQRGMPIQFVFPSSIAVYGVPDQLGLQKDHAVNEDEYTRPITIYGINKLYCENVGIYFSDHYKLLDESKKINMDFRAVRFPGIISAVTVPSGGTSDYAPEMIHSAAQGQGYESFVTPDAVLPFMLMPDAVRALLEYSKISGEKLTRRVYNVGGFSATAQELADVVNRSFPDSAISYAPDIRRQRIVNSWPADIDDSAAQKDWGWQPEYDLQKGFEEYLIPAIKQKYT